MPRTFSAAHAALLLALALASFAPVASGSSPRPAPAGQTDIASLPPALQGVISATLGERDPVYRVAAEGGGYRARNARQALDASLGSGGMAIAAGGGQWRMSLAGWERGASAQQTATLATKASGNRVEVERGGVTEWWVNGPVGLQQGWTVAARPFPGEAGALSLVMCQSGSLRARGGGERSLEVVDAGGRVVLRYGGLTAFDATGRELPVRFEVSSDEVRVRVEDAGAVYPVLVDPIAQQAYLKASNTQPRDSFGISVAISGDTVVVGAHFEDSHATGVNGNQEDAGLAIDSGAAYVFVRSAGVWSQQAYLKASNTGADDQFGLSVAISGDTIVVGAPSEDSNATGVNGNQANGDEGGSGAAYVFVRSGVTWSQQAYLKASNTRYYDWFGYSVAISGDTVVVGAYGEASNATGVNGNQADKSARDSGAAYVFTRSGGVWAQQAYLKASNTGAADNFGWSVAISGDTVVVGALGEDSNATGINGNQADNSAAQAGTAYVFTRSGATWSQQAYLKASNTGAADNFGSSVAISGDTVVVGAWGEDSNATGVNGNQANNSASNSGAAYVFTRSGATWSQQAYLKASNTGQDDRFGDSVAISGDTVVVGANWEESNATGVNGNQADNSLWEAGAAYVFTRSGGVWVQQAYLKASNTGAADGFGVSVAISGDTVVVGARAEESDATGVNGNQANNNAFQAGAAYVFAISAAPANPSRLSNLSTRGQVQTGDNRMIGGFIISGTAPKKVLVTARGPSLAAFGVVGAMTNPSLQLVSGQTVIASNDDFGAASNASEIQATGKAPTNALESAILTTLNPGAYTAIVSGVIGGTGVGIVEVFEIDGPTIPLTNLSTRGVVQTGDNVMIGGFVIEGTEPKTVLIRANGPSLAAFGVQGALANPTLRLNSGQTVVASNDDWQSASNASAIQATGLAPTNPLESAILVTLNPGAYTAIVSGVNGGTGVGIVEVFAR